MTRVGLVIAISVMAGCDLPATTHDARRPREFAVRMEITPGKPSAPTEEVSVHWRGGECSIHTARRSGSNEPFAKDDAMIDASRCRDLWPLAARLRELETQAKDSPMADFGSRSLTIEWRRDASPFSETRTFQWQQPLVKNDRVSALVRRLASLAGESPRPIQLHYFR